MRVARIVKFVMRGFDHFKGFSREHLPHREHLGRKVFVSSHLAPLGLFLWWFGAVHDRHLADEDAVVMAAACRTLVFFAQAVRHEKTQQRDGGSSQQPHGDLHGLQRKLPCVQNKKLYAFGLIVLALVAGVALDIAGRLSIGWIVGLGLMAFVAALELF